MSQRECPVVSIKLDAHPNAEKLSIVKVFGFTCCVKTEDWKDIPLGVYLSPDSIAPKDERFAFLGDHRRIKVKKLRGVISQGLLMPAPPEAKEGDDYYEAWGIEHYDPPEPMDTGGEQERHGPTIYYEKYDVESYNRYNTLLKEGESVVTSEKVHGSSSRFTFHSDRIWCGSRNEWKKEDPNNLWWKLFENTPEIGEWCKKHPDYILYGEAYGMQDLKYGCKPGEVRFVGFDILHGNKWLNWEEILEIRDTLPWVPVVYEGPFTESIVRELAEKDSIMPNAKNLAEGIVVKPKIERTHYRVGRIILKIISNRYMSR